ncbi:PIR Superfamily Protein [Plasmodium malariae]|uniref:PIR Superfamily Protein n=1 Tax=Plasmodium malariae TaxID=5858 RepID=A0A1A8X6Q0_PLAMA|nr:PIR Superfamily Protein [Plasmodium malariae]
MVKLETSKEELLLKHYFEVDNKPDDFTEQFSSFSSLERIHKNLYKIGYMLHKNFQYRKVYITLIDGPVSDSGNVTVSVSDTDYCELLNEWLNNKKNKYINEGSNCEENRQLWEEHIERFWEPIRKYVEDSFLCNRDTTPYNCSASPDLKTATPDLKTATPDLKTATPDLKTATPDLKTALFVGFTLLGTFLITFYFLYKVL